jgi:MalT-like TPR region
MLRFIAVILCFGVVITGSAAETSIGDVALSKADALADIYNWHAAAPYYAEAEKFFAAKHDTRKALLAHIGYIRATFEERSFSETARYFSKICDEPLAANDPEVQFKCLIAKGDTDAEIDSAPAEADWRRVLALARRLHNEKWRIRAVGEIGFARYVQGDHTTAKKNTGIALLQCQKTGDWAGEIRFSSGIGTGLALGGFERMGMPYLDNAIQLAQQHPASGYPYMAIAGKTMALIQKNDYDKAEPYAVQQREHAQADGRMVKFTQAQLFVADIAIGRGQRATAIKILMDTLPLAQQNHTRLVRDVYSKLSDLYRQQGDLKLADHFAESALAACQYSHDMYLAPSILLTIARMKITLGKDAQASVLLQRATDVIEGMLAHTTDVRAREAMLAVMSDVYRTHFALAVKHNDAARAFAIIEQVRGRFISELLVNKKVRWTSIMQTPSWRIRSAF